MNELTDYQKSIANYKCPKCGATFIFKKKYGRGNSFAACPNYPKCEFTVNYETYKKLKDSI